MRIRISAHKAEDIIESNMVETLHSNPKNAVRFTFSRRDSQRVTRELDYVMKQVAKLIKEKTSGTVEGVGADPTQSKAVVGVDEDLRQLTDRLMGMQSKLEIVPNVGMGGIGKTTLALKLYQDPAIVEHFTSLAWALKLLRVLDLLEMKLPTEILQIINLRYLAFSCSINRQLSSNISRLRNLQTLVISSTLLDHPIICLPCEILQMAELRHVVSYRAKFVFEFRDWGGFFLDKLQTIFTIHPSHEFLHRIPNIKTLGVRDNRLRWIFTRRHSNSPTVFLFQLALFPHQHSDYLSR